VEEPKNALPHHQVFRLAYNTPEVGRDTNAYGNRPGCRGFRLGV